MSDQVYIGDTHQELQVLAYFVRKGLQLDHNTQHIPEFVENGLNFRPDFVIRSSPNVIVEVDEDGHRTYDITNEIKRLEKIWIAFKKNVLFIRVIVNRHVRLSREQLVNIYDKVLSYKKFNISNDRIYVDHLFATKEDIARYLNYSIIDSPHRVASASITQSIPNEDLQSTQTVNSDEDSKSTKTTTSDEDSQRKSISTRMSLRFVCKRCEYDSHSIHHLFNHLNRKKICEPIDVSHDIPIQKLLDEVNTYIRDRDVKKKTNPIYQCQCGKIFTARSNLSRHNKKCCPQKVKTDEDLISILIDQIKKNGLENVIKNNIQK